MMKKENLEKVQRILELITRKWWFVVVFILLNILVPPIVTKGYDPSKTGEIIGYIIRHSLLTSDSLSSLYPIFKILPTILVFALIFSGNRFSRIFSFYVGINYILFAVLQYISISDTYGFAVVSGNFILTLVVSLLWFWEVAVKRNDFTPRKIPLIRFWVVPLAFLAFWYPLNLESMKPDFNLSYVFTNPVGLAFCNMTPVYLAILTLYYPRVNIVTLRITSLLGIIVGFWNLLVNFMIDPDILWWNGVLHLPLVFISIYALIFSFRKTQLI
ncbi:hypothetical protein ISS22_01890 [candidate division KSB1 bacterium]|nr:hypothetical protein [candidate division KSB1 bacterium]